uniref:Uncharacterized protein n=1 Tax=Acrobeloides nanus TaxID=290746 RepID=A0A914D5B1_9BILA
MDDSLWILKTWFKGLYRQSEIPCIERFEKFCPFLMHLCGQSSNVKGLEAFANDSALVIGTILRGINSDRMGNTLLKMILTPETGNRLYSFFKVDVYKKPLIQEVSKDESSRKYNLHLEIVNEPFSEIEMLDYKVYAVDLILKQFDREESSALLVDLLSACVYEWRSIESEQLQSVVDNEYQPFIVELGKEKIDRERNHLSVQYVLSALTEQLIDLKMEFSNVSLFKLLEVAE